MTVRDNECTDLQTPNFLKRSVFLFHYAIDVRLTLRLIWCYHQIQFPIDNLHMFGWNESVSPRISSGCLESYQKLTTIQRVSAYFTIWPDYPRVFTFPNSSKLAKLSENPIGLGWVRKWNNLANCHNSQIYSLLN